MKPQIKHNHEEEMYGLSKLLDATEELENSKKKIEKEIEKIQKSWHDKSSEKFMSKAMAIKEGYTKDLAELEEIIKEIRLVSNKMHEAEENAKMIAKERSVKD